MAVPKKKKSHSKTRMRRSKYQVTLPSLVPCPQCHRMRLPHKVCPFCGFYKGKQVITLKQKKSSES